MLFRSKGYREASRHLYIAQPSISEAVSDLESELGIKLFSREGRVARLRGPGEEADPSEHRPHAGHGEPHGRRPPEGPPGLQVAVDAARAGAQYGSQSVATAANSSGMTLAATTDGANISGLTATASQCTCVSGTSDRKSTRLNSSHIQKSRMPSSA